MNAPVTASERNAVALAPQSAGFDLSPRNFDEAWRMAEILADSDFVPKDYKGKPGNCLVAMQWGHEVGLKALQAMQNIAVINGRPALWGDSVIALVRGSPLCEWIIETEDATSSTCKVKRRGEPEQSRTFTDDDAKAAGLLGKQGPWTQYKRRMRQMRARAFALRDVFPDVLRGLPVAEEIMDAPPAERYMGAVDEVKPAEKPALPPYAADAFEKNLPAWKNIVDSGKKTGAALLAMFSTKNTFTPEQQAALKALDTPPPAEAQAPATDDFVADMTAAEGAAQ